MPVAIAVGYARPGPSLVTFILAAVALVPLAAVLSDATEDLSQHLGPGVGGALNATMGNAPELIIGIFAIRVGEVGVVKASLSGSIISNMLLVLGLSALAGGIGKPRQEFSRQTASANSTMLFIAVVALIMPRVFSFSAFAGIGGQDPRIETFSIWTSVVLLVTYSASLIFAHVTHPIRAMAAVEPEANRRSRRQALIAMIVTTVLISLLSERLAAQIEVAKRALHISDLFMGVIIIALIGNVAEHASAVTMAMRGKMELSLTISMGSSAQIALCVAPLLVLISTAFGRPMSLLFSPLEIVAIGLSVLIVEMIASDGETTWFEGIELLAVYLILAVAFYFVPAP